VTTIAVPKGKYKDWFVVYFFRILFYDYTHADYPYIPLSKLVILISTTNAHQQGLVACISDVHKFLLCENKCSHEVYLKNIDCSAKATYTNNTWDMLRL
jgi:hypothetical protein